MKIKRRSSAAGVPSVALADIAFNLILFFLILARAQDDSYLKWEPASTPRTEASAESRNTIAVDIDNKVYLNGDQVSVASLAPALEKQLADAPAGKRTVLLKINKDATALIFEPIMEAVSQAGGEIVHVLEEKAD
jgi:biopolymer transport protein ExbD